MVAERAREVDGEAQTCAESYERRSLVLVRKLNEAG